MKEKFTDLACQSCRLPVAQAEYETPSAMTFMCPACGHRWSAEAPGIKPH